MHFPSSLGWAALASVLLQVPAWADPPALLPDQAVARALATHPDLQTATATLAVARADRSRAAFLLDNPTLSGWTSTDGARAELSVGQPLSLSGQGWQARRAARSSIQASEHALARRRREVAARTRLAYVEAVVATGLVGVADEGAQLAGRLSFAVRRKHEEGEASTLDLRLARLAEVQSATRLLQARRTEAEALRALSGWVGVEVAAGDLATTPNAALPPPSTVRSPRADVLAAEAAVQVALAERRQARAATLPPVTLGARVAQEDGAYFVGPSVGLTLPLFDRNQQERATRSGALATAEARLQQVRARATTEQTTADQRVREADAAAERVQADIDEARAALASIEAGVLAGQIDLSTAVLLQSQVLDGEAAVVRLQGLLADAHLDQLLATDDDTLLGGAL